MVAELSLPGSQVRLLSVTFLTLSRLSDAWKVALNIVRSLLPDEQFRCVRVDNSAIELHNIVTDFPLCHLTSHWVSWFLGVQSTLSYLIEIGLNDFSWHSWLICVVNEVFKYFRWHIIWFAFILRIQLLCTCTYIKECFCAVKNWLSDWIVCKLWQSYMCWCLTDMLSVIS